MSRARGPIRLTAIVLTPAISLIILIASSTVGWKLPPRSDFPLVGGNWANQRYSTLDQINRSNVKKLGGAWTLHLEDGEPAGLAGNMEATPIVVDGTMFISSGAGNVFAIDAKTGGVKWKFWTLPGPGEIGHDTWEGDSWQHGGGPIWTQPAIDPDLGLVYIAIGNAGPDNDGRNRGGDNLFTASVVALDLKTGAYKWHYQEVHHDVWDYDSAASPVLADVTYRGEARKILLHAGKTGFLYILDRTDGKPLIGIEEKSVPQERRMKTAKTQPFPVGDSFVPTCPEAGSVDPRFKSICIFGANWEEASAMTPGTKGGVSWSRRPSAPQ